MFTRLAQALASSFNYQGRVRKTFYVLSDDKVVAGVRRTPLASKSSTSTETVQPMETDSEPTVAPVVPSQPSQPTLAAKLSASLANKRKATEPPEQSGSNDKPKRR
jgi:hypothetical protein